MNSIRTNDGTEIYFKDWGQGQPIVFSHGWPLSADDWDAQMLFFLAKGYRVIAHDRRGHGRSTQTSGGHDMDHYAADLAALTAHLDLKNAVHVGHSTGGGEVVHYIPDRLHRRPEEDHCARSRNARRRRQNRALCRFRASVGEATEEWHAENLQRISARHAYYRGRDHQHGPARVH